MADLFSSCQLMPLTQKSRAEASKLQKAKSVDFIEDFYENLPRFQS